MRRPVLLAVALVALIPPSATAQDGLLKGVAWVEALSPAGVLLVQGVDSAAELALLGGALVLYTGPNVSLLLFESDGNPDGVRISRLISAGVGLTTAAVSFGLGVAAAFGTLYDWGLTPYAGSLLAISVPTLFAGIIDLIEYSVERGP